MCARQCMQQPRLCCGFCREQLAELTNQNAEHVTQAAHLQQLIDEATVVQSSLQSTIAEREAKIVDLTNQIEALHGQCQQSKEAFDNLQRKHTSSMDSSCMCNSLLPLIN